MAETSWAGATGGIASDRTALGGATLTIKYGSGHKVGMEADIGAPRNQPPPGVSKQFTRVIRVPGRNGDALILKQSHIDRLSFPLHASRHVSVFTVVNVAISMNRLNLEKMCPTKVREHGTGPHPQIQTFNNAYQAN